MLSSIGLSRFAPGDMDFIPGPGPRTIDLGEAWGKVGMQLCYEIIFSGEVVDRRHRPDFIFNPSNDAWFGRWGPQHWPRPASAPPRKASPSAVDTDGFSAIIDHMAHHRVWNGARVIDGPLPPAASSLTPFARFGNLIPLLLAFALLIGGIAMGRTRR